MTIRQRIKAFAKNHGFRVKNDPDTFAALEYTEKKYGVMLCPCRFIGEKPQASSIITSRCPCADVVRMEKGELTECHCGLFYTQVNEYPNGG